MTRLIGVLPDQLRRNMIAVYTNCECYDDCSTRNVIQRTNLNIPEDRTFYMENSAFSKDYAALTGTEKLRLERQWKLSLEASANLFSALSELKNIDSHTFQVIIKQRNRLKVILHDVSFKIQNLAQLQCELDQANTISKDGASQAEQFKSFTTKKTVTRKVMVETNYHNTLCDSCHYVCHQHCGLQEITQKGSNQFVNCAAFCGDRCVKCPKKCSYTTHYHARKDIVERTETIDEILDDVKKKYDAALRQQSGAIRLLKTLDDVRLGIDCAIRHEVAKLKDSCTEIIAHCSGFNLVNEISATIGQLEKDLTRLRNFESVNSARAHIDLMKKIAEELSQMGEVNNFPPIPPSVPSPSHQLAQGNNYQEDESPQRQASVVFHEGVGRILRPDVFKKLRDIIGMKKVKEAINNLVMRAIVDVERSKILGKPVKFKGFGHFIFKGNPGTGKSLIADLLPLIFEDIKKLYDQTQPNPPQNKSDPNKTSQQTATPPPDPTTIIDNYRTLRQKTNDKLDQAIVLIQSQLAQFPPKVASAADVLSNGRGDGQTGVNAAVST